MFMPTLSSSGNNRALRIAGLAALIFGASTGVVLAANTGCQVALRWEAVRAQTTLTHKAHHSAATLARWKVGAEAWSKAHHGKVYAGHPPAPVAVAWKPLRYSCDDVALETDFGTPMLTEEAAPEFSAYASVAGSHGPELEIASTQIIPPDDDGFLPAVYGAPVGGGGWTNGTGARGASPNGPVGPSSFPPVGQETTPVHRRLLPPKHPPQEVTLLPAPLPPPVIVPTPEPSALILLATGVASLGLSRARRWFAI